MRGSNGARAGIADDLELARREMVAKQIQRRGIRSPRVLEAMAQVPRHLFVSPHQVAEAYADTPLAIGDAQTISQPFMVAAMAEELSLEGSERVLEVGAGSGYQAAVLSLLAREVIAMESQPALAAQARERLARLGYPNVHVETGDGSLGWPAGSPYDAILVSAGSPAVPPPLIEQLAEGGRLVIPVGSTDHQQLQRIVKRSGHTETQPRYDCRFVPLLGRFGWHLNRQDVSTG